MVYLFKHKVNNHNIIFYLSESKFPYATIIDLIRQNNDCIVCWSDIVVDENIIRIQWFETNFTYRNKGFGNQLLQFIIQYAKKNNITQIELDDMTDRSNKLKNIYRKNGFVYLENGYPEMILYL